MLEKFYGGTPEAYMSTQGTGNNADVDTEALTRTLDRAEALCLLLGCQLDGSTDRLDNSILFYAVDALEAVIVQAQMLITGHSPKT